MISFTSAELDAWLTAFLFPMARILAMMASAPIFNNRAAPARIRLAAGLVVTFALVPVLPPMPAIAPGSWLGLAVIGQEILIGVMMGFTLRLAFSAIDVAGSIVGMQMGLSFAVSYDPQTAGQTPVLSEFLTLFATLLFLAMNGHLLSLSVLSESFRLLPVGLAPLQTGGFTLLVAWAGVIFSAGLLLALPLITTLLIANLAMGVLARVAPQLNIFAVGFPVTLMAGFVLLMFSIPYIGTALERLFDQSFQTLAAVMRAAGAGI